MSLTDIFISEDVFSKASSSVTPLTDGNSLASLKKSSVVKDEVFPVIFETSEEFDFSLIMDFYSFFTTTVDKIIFCLPGRTGSETCRPT